MQRNQNRQSVSWFWDLYQRKRLDLDPPYQRRSVWNQGYKDYFIDTILLDYPAPAIFLYEEISPDGRTLYHVVDGKQRLTTIFDFVNDEFPISQDAKRTELRDKYFRELSDEVKQAFWGYQFSVEYMPNADESVINDIFDRINRNTAKLSAQELRHARFSGEFIEAAEQLAEWLEAEIEANFPNIAARSRRQMKDVELVAHLLLLLEQGPRGYSTLDLDEAFSQRDGEWEGKHDISNRFRRVVGVVASMLEGDDGQNLARSRFRNQADFYSLFGALDELVSDRGVVEAEVWRQRLIEFAAQVDSEDARAEDPGLREYYEAARSASNDTGPRAKRIRLTKLVLLGEPLDVQDQGDPASD